MIFEFAFDLVIGPITFFRLLGTQTAPGLPFNTTTHCLRKISQADILNCLRVEKRQIFTVPVKRNADTNTKQCYLLDYCY